MSEPLANSDRLSINISFDDDGRLYVDWNVPVCDTRTMEIISSALSEPGLDLIRSNLFRRLYDAVGLFRYNFIMKAIEKHHTEMEGVPVVPHTQVFNNRNSQQSKLPS